LECPECERDAIDFLRHAHDVYNPYSYYPDGELLWLSFHCAACSFKYEFPFDCKVTNCSRRLKQPPCHPRAFTYRQQKLHFGNCQKCGFCNQYICSTCGDLERLDCCGELLCEYCSYGGEGRDHYFYCAENPFSLQNQYMDAAMEGEIC
jgi:hypothetical protein